MEARLILLTGGARAGKSAFAQEQAQALGGGQVSLIATAQALDEEMQTRVAKHQAQRPAGWQTLESPLEVIHSFIHSRHNTVLLDCLTLWVSNLMLAERDVMSEIEGLLAAQAESRKTLLVVTNEVGMGIVPDNALARRYRDLLGAANRRMAQQAGEVYLLVSGIPLKIKPF